MTTTKVRDRSHFAWLRIGTLAVAALVAGSGVLFATPVAGASGGLSSTILAEPQPGLVAATPGPFNGPLTESNAGLVLGSAAGTSNALRQSLTSGDVTAYVRLWTRQPTNGDAVLILAFQFNDSLLESSFLDGLDGALHGQTGATPFAVPSIPGAAGAALQTSSSGTPVSDYVVAFAKGNTAFEINVASTSGDLTAADTIAMANSQFAAAPDVPAGSGTHWKWNTGGIVFGGGVLLVIAIFVIGRVRKYPVALRGWPAYSGGSYGGLPASRYAPPQPSWSPPAPSPSGAPTNVSTDQWP